MRVRSLVPSLSLAAFLATGVMALAPAAAQADYEGARYAVAVTSPEFGNVKTDTRNFLWGFTLSWPRAIGQNAGTFTYKRPGGGPVVCSGRLVLVETRAGYPVEFGEIRKSPSVKGVKSSWRASIRKARSWCKPGKWRTALRASGNVYSALENKDGTAPAQLAVFRRSGGSASGLAVLKP